MSSQPRRRRRLSERAREGGTSQAAEGDGSPRQKRACTVDTRLVQLEDSVTEGVIKIDVLKKKLTDSQNECYRLIEESQRLREELAKQRNLARTYKSEAAKHARGDAARQAQARIQELEQQCKEAWDQCKIAEREKRRAMAAMQRNLDEVSADLRSANVDAERAADEHRKNCATMRTKIRELESQNEDLKRNRGGLFSLSADQDHAGAAAGAAGRNAARMQAYRLRDSLTSYLDHHLEGGATGQLAKAMMTTFFSEHPQMLRDILNRLPTLAEIEKETVDAIEEQWTLDICAAMFVHGELTYAGYQAILNIMSKAYSFENDRFEPMILPQGSEMPKLKSKNSLHEHIKEIADEFGIKSMQDGRAAALDVRTVLRSRLQAIKKVHDRYDLPMPDSVQIQLAADAATWRKRPTNSMMKNFTAFAVKVILAIPRGAPANVAAQDAPAIQGPARVGDSINSLHNNKMALLYAGKALLCACMPFPCRAHCFATPCCLIRKWFRVFSEMVFWEIQNGFFGNVFLGKHMFFVRKRCFLRNTLQTRKFKLI